ncbi:nuclear transport factor 2 domain-containing protein [Colletotrichum musicola]|uniref:Nuclear transport factor 2 domain-containing protein n=2 Tax=Colletotrichum orchidearum species complex TaxID=2707337 RepID=A0A8H6NZ06_9PEZI|nr:nuclear transport factor 2 domain-containing protein [Colletotrichum sojae]KAF6845049.1 nuclear transport factor 2 domain-containing protein [Colletotrichum musicola]
MSLPSRDTELKASADAASNFVDLYYQALNRRAPQGTISNFYTTACAKYPTPPDISINGAVLAGGPDDYVALLDAQGPDVSYEVESVDAHVINPDFELGCPEHLQEGDKSGAKCSVLAQVTGRVYYGKGRDAPAKTFNEVFVLVPNWDTFGKNPPRGARRWLVMSQNFRAL